MLAFESGTDPGSTLFLIEILVTSVLYICEIIAWGTPVKEPCRFCEVHQNQKVGSVSHPLIAVFEKPLRFRR